MYLIDPFFAVGVHQKTSFVQGLVLDRSFDSLNQCWLAQDRNIGLAEGRSAAQQRLPHRIGCRDAPIPPDQKYGNR